MTENVPLWESGGWTALPSLEGHVATEVCVVGLGGSGLSAVAELRRLGHEVVGVDAGSVACGASGRNAGFMLSGTAAFYHEARRLLGGERARALYELTREGLRHELEAAGPAARAVGSLRIAADAGELADCEAQYEAMREDGLPVERYSGPEGSGLFFPEDLAVNPLARCRNLAAAALADGAVLYERSRVVDVEGGRVTLETGTVTCDAVVVAVDGHLVDVLPELGDRVRSIRLQMLGTAPVPGLELPRPVYRRYGYEYYQQDTRGRLALGGFRDEGGAAEETGEEGPTEAIQALLERYLRERLRVDAPITHRWAASVSYSGGLLPIAEQVRPGVWAVGAYNGTGNVTGAVLGRAAARRAVGKPSAAWDTFGGR